MSRRPERSTERGIARPGPPLWTFPGFTVDTHPGAAEILISYICSSVFLRIGCWEILLQGRRSSCNTSPIPADKTCVRGTEIPSVLWIIPNPRVWLKKNLTGCCFLNLIWTSQQDMRTHQGNKGKSKLDNLTFYKSFCCFLQHLDALVTRMHFISKLKYICVIFQSPGLKDVESLQHFLSDTELGQNWLSKRARQWLHPYLHLCAVALQPIFRSR